MSGQHRAAEHGVTGGEVTTEAPDTVEDALRLLADWLDEADRLIDAVFAAKSQDRLNRGDAVQQDMRRLADWFAAHPDAAAHAWAYVRARADVVEARP